MEGLRFHDLRHTAAALDELVQAAAALAKDQPPAVSGTLVAREGRAKGPAWARGTQRGR